jgi:sterol desaturase/sphingolipid hydroxylase (fatty acid hydroxylase superfamily)
MHKMHLAHHDDPLAVDQLFLSRWLSAPIAVGYWLLARTILGDWHSVAYMFVGLVAGYCSYEWLHYQAHHGASRLSLLKYLKKYHLLHHGETPNLRFGVTSPLFDYLFGTYQPVTQRHERS